MACFVDDAQSTAIFRNRKFINLCLKHRHLCAMPGEEASLGLSLLSRFNLILVQEAHYRGPFVITPIVWRYGVPKTSRSSN